MTRGVFHKRGVAMCRRYLERGTTELHDPYKPNYITVVAHFLVALSQHWSTTMGVLYQLRLLLQRVAGG